eukprot:g37571.t1
MAAARRVWWSSMRRLIMIGDIIASMSRLVLELDSAVRWLMQQWSMTVDRTQVVVKDGSTTKALRVAVRPGMSNEDVVRTANAGMQWFVSRFVPSSSVTRDSVPYGLFPGTHTETNINCAWRTIN